MLKHLVYQVNEMIIQFVRLASVKGPITAIRAAASWVVGSKRLGLSVEFEFFFRGKHGLEIGGPSQVFSPRQAIPIYPIAMRVDNCNFSNTTVWSDSQRREEHCCRRNRGMMFVCEGTHLGFANDETYDFILSSHTLEHMANPLDALMEWKRVLRYGGVILLCVPHKCQTFDHKRPVTPIEHMIEDYRLGTGEDDLTHLPEILRLHDLSRDIAVGSHEEFMLRSERNLEYRCLHHHVFVTESVIRLLDHAGLRILEVATYPPSSIVVLSEKSCQAFDATHENNMKFISDSASWRAHSHFDTERKRGNATFLRRQVD